MPTIVFGTDELEAAYDTLSQLLEVVRRGGGGAEWHVLGAARILVHDALLAARVDEHGQYHASAWVPWSPSRE